MLLLLIIGMVFIPSNVYAWGTLTHIYLANEIFYLAPLLPAGIYSIVKRYKKDFLYGNIMADTIFAKGLLPLDKNPHNWDVAFDMLEKANNASQRAFVYGYLCHLAADTVAHGDLVRSGNLNHTIMELKVDRLINSRYWFQAVMIDREIQVRNDIFLKGSLESAIFSFKTNKRLFKGFVFLSILNKTLLPMHYIRKGQRFRNKMHALSGNIKWPSEIKRLREISLERMVDVLYNGKDSRVTKRSPFLEI
ncbi:MAG: zinc dependent phospholipase C family protein [Nitrospirota bacterium]